MNLHRHPLFTRLAKPLLVVVPGLLFSAYSLLAIEVDPGKVTFPPSTYDQGGNHFSIFNGDPKRIQKANEVDPKAFDASIQVSPNPAVLSALRDAQGTSPLKISLAVHNHSKRTFTMSFPNAQRWQMVVKNSSGLVIFDYTKAHDFVDAIGTTIVDPDDQLTFTESLDLTDFTADLAPGDYTVEANVANYPEIHATGTFHVLDHL